MTAAPSGAELAARQAAPQAGAREVLAAPGLAALRRDHLSRHDPADQREASAGSF